MLAHLDFPDKGPLNRCRIVMSKVTGGKQALTLLTKDKEFYSKQLCQVETKLRYADDRIVQLNDQLEKTKQAREDLFSEYVASRCLHVVTLCW